MQSSYQKRPGHQPAPQIPPSRRNRRVPPQGSDYNLAMQAHYHRTNHTGLPDGLKSVAENRSGYDLSDVRVHRNSSRPAQWHAHALTQGNQIFLATGQDHLLSHELWHSVQQKQGRVRPSSSTNPINADVFLEREANTALDGSAHSPRASLKQGASPSSAVQLAPNQAGICDPDTLLEEVRRLEAQGLSHREILARVRDKHGGNTNRYFYTDRYGWVDIRHFGEAGRYANSIGNWATETLGLANEALQWITEWGDDYRSGFSPEDIPSNAAGAEFGDDYVNEGELLSESLARWMQAAGARPASDPSARADQLPATDPAERGGANRGASNVSRTQSTLSGEINNLGNEWSRGWRWINTPEFWMQLYGL